MVGAGSAENGLERLWGAFRRGFRAQREISTFGLLYELPKGTIYELPAAPWTCA